MRVKTEAFLDRVANDPELLKTLVGNRAKQYRFFKRNDKIDALVKYSFVKDDAFRKEILSYFKKLDAAYAKKVAKFAAANPDAPVPEQDPYPIVEHQVLEDLRAQIRELNESIPELSADDWLAGRLAQASGAGNLPLMVRIEAALAATEDPVSAPRAELVKLVGNAEVWPQVGLSGKLWILNEYGKSRPDEVIRFLERARLDFFNTSVELLMHQILAECYQRAGHIRKAITQYEVLIKRFASSDAAGEAAMKIGLMEIDEGNYAAARERLESILYHNEWRGLRHGQALLWIGRAYVAEGKYAEAHGFFERIMLGYPGFNELLGTAYYEDILALKKMGEPESVKTVYEAFKMTPGLEDTEAAALIRKEFE
jgi:tetratricopeptide (TPR) repeat protein